jgi:ABC-type glycerol-3-phosphate transport system permease component
VSSPSDVRQIGKNREGMAWVSLVDPSGNEFASLPQQFGLREELSAWAVGRGVAHAGVVTTVPVIAGWLTQKQLVRGLMSGAVK